MRVLVELPQGAVAATVFEDHLDARGIRYAEHSGARFSEAVPSRAVQAAPAAFPQRPGALDLILGGALMRLPQREDAFDLRVQAPAGVRNAPVLVFIPGGGFMSGSAEAEWFDARALVREGVVVVTVSYRLGALGHLGTSGDPADANRPLRDLMLALAWVREHIGAFGGDPGQVTIAGDSAGAWYARALASLPQTRGWFARALLVSLPYERPLDAAGYAARHAVWLEALGGADPETAEAAALLDAQGAVAAAFRGRGMALMPATDGVLLDEDAAEPDRVGTALHVEELALLTARNEAAAFLLPAPEAAFQDAAVGEFLAAHFADAAVVDTVLRTVRPEGTPKQYLSDAMTLFQFRSYAHEVATAFAGTGRAAWIARLNEPSPLPGAGTPHCFTLPFLFGSREAWADAPMLAGMPQERFARTSARTIAWVAGFVRGQGPGVDTGTGVGGAPQPEFDAQRPAAYEFDADGGNVMPMRQARVRALRGTAAASGGAGPSSS